MFSRDFGVNRDIISEQANHNPIPFNFGYTSEPLSGKITIAGRNNKLDTKRLSQIAKWLYKDDYKPLISNDNPDIVYYIKFTDQADLSLGNADEGYISLSFVANAPWGWSKPYTKTVDLRKNEGIATVDVYNTGNYYDYNGLEIETELPVLPKIIYVPSEYKNALDLNKNCYNTNDYIKYVSSETTTEPQTLSFRSSNGTIYITVNDNLLKDYVYIFTLTYDYGHRGDDYYTADIVWSDKVVFVDEVHNCSIRNTRNTKIEDAFVLSDYFVGEKQLDRYKLLDGEHIHINMQNQTIESDNATVPSRMINCNQKWIRLEQGKNVFEITGKGIFTFRCQYPVII